ncbi:brevican core protein-like [Acropora palmata]|uniref:brevican core protein-like n=1 Tax=Acropora palmata TaxID=6131 RepID=UPI003D9FE0EF
MKALMLLLKVLLLLFLFSPACISKADQAGAMISQKVNTREIDFVNFREAKFSFLNITALVKRVVENSFLCAFSCLKNLACFSFNVAAFPDKAGKFTCEILTSDKYNNSENFLPSKTLHHFSIESPCSSWPCRNNGTCVSLYETNSYVCICNKGFTGTHCEMALCPAGFVVYKESCYYINKEMHDSWNNSRKFCQSLGADLAVIKSFDENKFLLDKLLKKSNRATGWIGLRRTNDTFYWLDDRVQGHDSPGWDPKEPNNLGGNEKCGELRQRAQWNDLNCDKTTPAPLCQKPFCVV